MKNSQCFFYFKKNKNFFLFLNKREKRNFFQNDLSSCFWLSKKFRNFPKSPRRLLALKNHCFEQKISSSFKKQMIPLYSNWLFLQARPRVISSSLDFETKRTTNSLSLRTNIIPNFFLLIELFLKTKNFFEKKFELLLSFKKQKNEKFLNFLTSKVLRRRNTTLFVFFEILFSFLSSFQNRLGFLQNLCFDFLKSFASKNLTHFSTQKVQKSETYRSETKAPLLREEGFESFFQKEKNCSFFSFFCILEKNKNFLCSFSSILFFFFFRFFKNEKFSKISHNFFQISRFRANLQYLQKGSLFLKNLFEDFEGFFSFFEFSSKISQRQFSMSLDSLLKETQQSLLRSEQSFGSKVRIKPNPLLRALSKNQKKFQLANLGELQTCFKSQNINSFVFKKTLQKEFFASHFNDIFFDTFKIFPFLCFEKKFDFCAPLLSSVPYPFLKTMKKKGLQNFLTQQFFCESKRTFQKSLFHFQESSKKFLFRKTQNAFLWILSKKGAFRGSAPWLQDMSKTFRKSESDSSNLSSSIASQGLETVTAPIACRSQIAGDLHFASSSAFVTGAKREKILRKKKSFFFFVQNSFFVSRKKFKKGKSLFSLSKNFFVFANEKTNLCSFFRSFHKSFIFSNFSFFCFSEFQNFFTFFENFFQTFTRIHGFSEKEFIVNLFKKDGIQKVFLSFLFQKTFFFFENMCFQKKTFFQTFREGNCFFPKKSLFHNLQTKKALFSKSRFFFSFFLFFFPSFLQYLNVPKKIEQKKFQKFCKKIFFEKFKKSVFRLSFQNYFFFLFFHLQKSFQNLFSNGKMPNRSMLQKYLNECKDFLQRSRGKTQLFIMKELQQKICRLCACFVPSKEDIRFQLSRDFHDFPPVAPPSSSNSTSPFGLKELRAKQSLQAEHSPASGLEHQDEMYKALKRKQWQKKADQDMSEERKKDTKFFYKQIFISCDSLLFQFLWSWARKRHPNKSKSWIQKKYFHLISEKKWVFGKKSRNAFLYLTLPSDLEREQSSSSALF